MLSQAIKTVPQEALPADIGAVSRTAELLEVGPFAVFRLAYHHWYGELPDDGAIEPAFVHYLYNETCPTYVRHFTRLIEIQAERGRLDPVEYGLPAPPRETMSIATLDRLSLALYAVVGVAIFWVMPAVQSA